MERTVSCSPYTLTVLWEDPAAPALYTVSEAGDARGLFASLPAPRPTLVCIEGVDWDRDLSPRAAKKVFRGGEDFSGEANAFLQTLLTELIPAAEAGLSPACCDPLLRRAVRVSMGTVFQVPWARLDSLDTLKQAGFVTLAMALKPDALSLDDPTLQTFDKLAVVLGTEGDGLCQDTIARCDWTARIPMFNGVDSLNVAAASAVAFWQLGKRSL